jgi:outer membrane usher protein FimD/PapC
LYTVLLRVFTAWFVLIATALSSHALAAESGRFSSDDLVIVSLFVNTVPKGEAFVVVTDAGGVWIPDKDYRRLGISLEGRKTTVDGRDYIHIVPSDQISITFSAEALSLRLDVAPELLGLQRFSLASSPRLQPSPAPNLQGFINYSIGSQRATGTEPLTVADVAFNAAWSDWVLRSDHTYASIGPRAGALRLQTFLQHDDVNRMLRWTMGDTVPTVGTFSRAAPIAGVSVSRLFELAPGFQANPTFSYSGIARVPMTAEVFIDGVRIRTIDIKPGRYDLFDLSYFAGLRNVEIVLRDRGGFEQRTSLGHFFNNTNLARGVHQFRYDAGRVRDPELPNKYSGASFSGLHRYGMTDHITIGAAGERAVGYARGSLSSVVSTRYGVGAIDVAASRALGTSQTGRAALINYGYSAQSFSVGASGLWQSTRFGQSRDELGLVNLEGQPRDPLAQQLQLSAGRAFADRRSVSMSVIRGETHGGAVTKLNTIRFTQGFGSGYSLAMGASSGSAQGQSTRTFYIGFTVPLGSRVSTNLMHERLADQTTSSAIRIAQSVPTGEGFGFRLAHDSATKAKNSEVFTQWNHPYGNVAVSARRLAPASADETRFIDARAGGSLVWAQHRFFLSSPIQQSFGVVDVDGVAGVRVYQNGQLAGKTRGDGTLLLPALSAYVANQVRIDDRDIPLDREIRQVIETLVPRALIGGYARFASKRVIAVSGQLVWNREGQKSSVSSAELTIAGHASIRTTTSPEGDFYIEDLQPGAYQLIAENRLGACGATIVIEASRSSLQELGEVVCAVQKK